MARNSNRIDYSGGPSQGFKSFSGIEDPRTGGSKRHHFGEVLFMVVTGVLCGMNGFADIKEFCHEDLEWIKIPNGISHALTFSNIFDLSNPARFNQCLMAHLSTLNPTLAAQIIAVDAKALRGES